MSLAATAPSLMARLKEATADLHRHAETRTLQRSLVTGVLPPATYRAYLIELHALHAALEAALAPLADEQPALAFLRDGALRHSANIAHDLATLAGGQPEACAAIDGGTAARRELVQFIMDAASRRQILALLGSLYVLEGSMNGNRFIARALRKSWRLSGSECLRYLDPYGDGQQPAWQRFREAMDALHVTPEDVNAAVEAACRTFDALARISDDVLALHA